MATQMDKKKVIITGASGLLGRALVRVFHAASWEVIGLAHTRAKNDLVQVDLLDTNAVTKLISDTKPNAIIHAAAERNCNVVDNNYAAAYTLNVTVSEHIARLAGQIGAVHIYISTDYVFDGTSPPYQETSNPNPLNKYGITKLEGEKVTRQANPDACILRVPLLYGPVDYLQESVVTGLLANLLNTEKTSEISDYEIRYPTHVDDVAEVCFRLIAKAFQQPNTVTGIYHCSGRDAMTKYRMIEIISDTLHLPMGHIIRDPHPTKGAPRPYDSHLDISRLDSLVGVPYTPLNDAIKECLTKFVPVH